LRTMMSLPPSVRLPMLPSSRIVWASKPPSMEHPADAECRPQIQA
jgi:hypothetical protein